jgi:hypothetical protein
MAIIEADELTKVFVYRRGPGVVEGYAGALPQRFGNGNALAPIRTHLHLLLLPDRATEGLAELAALGFPPPVVITGQVSADTSVWICQPHPALERRDPSHRGLRHLGEEHPGRVVIDWRFGRVPLSPVVRPRGAGGGGITVALEGRPRLAFPRPSPSPMAETLPVPAVRRVDQ